jgi:hypothetical protein
MVTRALPLAAAIGLAPAALPETGAREVSPEALVAPAEQVRAYAADERKTVVELQQFRRTRSQVVSVRGRGSLPVTLVDLSPAIGAWYVLTLGADGGSRRGYHLQNPAPEVQELALDPSYPDGLVLRAGGREEPCDLWSSGALEQAFARRVPYAPLCGGRLYLRNAVPGYRTELGAVTDFLRDHVWGGEAVVSLAKETVFRDAQLERAWVAEATGLMPGSARGPAPARLDPRWSDRLIGTASLGIAVDAAARGQLGIGAWYPARDVDGVYVSLIEPQAVAADVLASHRARVNPLDGVESSALVYLVGFDLRRFDLAFALGTNHPRVDWSPRPPAAVRTPSLPGPDGIGSPSPLVPTGMVPPRSAARTVATFAGGFKRAHGAFKYGDLAQRNAGSHYGFVEEGAVFSKLRPGLSTLYVLADGAVAMNTWSEEDERLLARVRYARQNGVPLVEWDATAGAPVPGALVNRWGPGNWSGSAKEELRSVRAGACLQETADRRFLVYAYFSSATPSAMARVFQAYGCRHGMLLDMNAPVLTYLALLAPQAEDGRRVQHLVQAMAEGDQQLGGRTVPRFVGFPDERDFFYVMRREGGEAPR